MSQQLYNYTIEVQIGDLTEKHSFQFDSQPLIRDLKEKLMSIYLCQRKNIQFYFNGNELKNTKGALVPSQSEDDDFDAIISMDASDLMKTANFAHGFTRDHPKEAPPPQQPMGGFASYQPQQKGGFGAQQGGFNPPNVPGTFAPPAGGFNPPRQQQQQQQQKPRISIGAPKPLNSDPIPDHTPPALFQRPVGSNQLPPTLVQQPIDSNQFPPGLVPQSIGSSPLPVLPTLEKSIVSDPQDASFKRDLIKGDEGNLHESQNLQKSFTGVTPEQIQKIQRRLSPTTPDDDDDDDEKSPTGAQSQQLPQDQLEIAKQFIKPIEDQWKEISGTEVPPDLLFIYNQQDGGSDPEQFKKDYELSGEIPSKLLRLREELIQSKKPVDNFLKGFIEMPPDSRSVENYRVMLGFLPK